MVISELWLSILLKDERFDAPSTLRPGSLKTQLYSTIRPPTLTLAGKIPPKRRLVITLPEFSVKHESKMIGEF